MSMNDTLAGALSTLNNADDVGKQECFIGPASKTISNVLKLLKQHKYIQGYKDKVHANKQSVVVELNGKINKCGVIKPRHAVPKDGFEKFEKRYLIAKNFGILVVSTSQGIMTHNEAKTKGLGGRLLAYCY